MNYINKSQLQALQEYGAIIEKIATVKRGDMYTYAPGCYFVPGGTGDLYAVSTTEHGFIDYCFVS